MGKNEPYLRTLSYPALDLDAPAVSAHDALDHRQSEADILARGGAHALDPIEPLEDVRQMIQRDAAPGIADSNQNALLVIGRCKLDGAAGRRVRERV